MGKRFLIILTFISLMMTNCGNTPNNKNMGKIVEEFYKDSLQYMGENGLEYYDEPQLCYKVESNGKVFELHAVIYDFYKNGRNIISNSDFRFLPYPEFRTKILDLYKVDMDTCYFAYLDPNIDIFDVVHDGYINVGSPGYEEPEIMVRVNKMVLNDDIHSFNWLKAHHPSEIIYQVQALGVSSNEQWLEFAIENSDLDDYFTFEDFVMGIKGEKTFLRRDMLEALAAKDAGMAHFGMLLETIESMKKEGYEYDYHGNMDDDIDYLFKKIYDEGQVGYIESRVDSDRSLLDKFESKGYYGSEGLKTFCKNYMTPDERQQQGKKSNFDPEQEYTYVVKDPDGYVNMRSGKGTNFDVVIQVPDGAVVKTSDKDDGDWIYIHYKGKNGYVHRSRLQEK